MLRFIFTSSSLIILLPFKKDKFLKFSLIFNAIVKTFDVATFGIMGLIKLKFLQFAQER